METRSQTNNNRTALYEVNIDFDEAIEAWRSNKKSIGNGNYKYICSSLKKNGEKCGVKCTNGEMYCKIHYKKFSKSKI